MAEPDHPQHVSLELDEGYRFEVRFADGLPALSMDEPEPLGEGSGPNASAVLAAAVGNCLSASLLFCLRRAHVDVAHMVAEVDVTPVRNEKGRKRIGAIDVVLRPVLGEDASEGRYQRCRDVFEDYCVVSDSVRHGIDVSVRVEPVAPS
jgi:organic hydroperoxide reductase OsmC/OhrA